jgi:hypothetical protein
MPAPPITVKQLQRRLDAAATEAAAREHEGGGLDADLGADALAAAALDEQQQQQQTGGASRPRSAATSETGVSESSANSFKSFTTTLSARRPCALM